MVPNESRTAKSGSIFAAALNQQGRFAQTKVGDFEFRPEAERHLWKGKMATSMAELAELVNGAIKSLEAFGDPNLRLEAVAIGTTTAEVGCQKPEASEEDKDSIIAALKTANAELRLALLAPRGKRERVETA